VVIAKVEVTQCDPLSNRMPLGELKGISLLQEKKGSPIPSLGGGNGKASKKKPKREVNTFT